MFESNGKVDHSPEAIQTVQPTDSIIVSGIQEMSLSEGQFSFLSRLAAAAEAATAVANAAGAVAQQHRLSLDNALNQLYELQEIDATNCSAMLDKKNRVLRLVPSHLTGQQ